MRVRIFRRWFFSPLISTLLVRSSATSPSWPAPSVRCACASEVSTRTTSPAVACSSGTTSMSSSPARSIRSMMRSSLRTFAARSEMMSMLEGGWAAR